MPCKRMPLEEYFSPNRRATLESALVFALTYTESLPPLSSTPLNAKGYGLTETCGVVTGSTLSALDPVGLVGGPFRCCRVSLVSCPELLDGQGRPYLVDDRVDERGRPCLGRGEVVVAGHNLAARYFKQPAVTAEVFRQGAAGAEFLTGDVGCWRADGSLAIVDRRKNLVKLNGGE